MNNRKLRSSKAAYLRRRKQKILRKLVQIHNKNGNDDKFDKTSRLLSRTHSEMSRLMDRA